MPNPSEKPAFVAVAPLYDLLMTGVPYDEWITYLDKLLTLRQIRPRRILDLACGTGNVSERLVERGYAVVGADIAADMIAEAQHKAEMKNLPIAYYVQDAAELDLPEDKFQLCLSLFDSLNYILEPERLQLALNRVAAHLDTGGLFIFDMNTEYALKHRFFDQDNLAYDERLRYDWDSEYFDETRRCRVRMRFWYREEDGKDRAFEEIHWQYAYRMPEILTMLHHAGFTNIDTYQAYTLRSPGRAADRIFYIAEKV